MDALMKRYIKVTFRKEGIHCYPAAGTDPALSDVSFLAQPHRHIFHFEVKISVEHNNRALEFILVKRELESRYENSMNINHKSCEMLAEDLVDYIVERWGNREVEVGVYEDGENGGIIHRETVSW